MLNYLEYSEIIFDTSYSFIGQFYQQIQLKLDYLVLIRTIMNMFLKEKKVQVLNGAYGLFGSSVLKTVRVIVR